MSEVLEATPPAGELKRLRLPTMRRQYAELETQAREEGWSYSEYLERLVPAEVMHLREVRLARAARQAGSPFLKTLEELDFTFRRRVSRPQLGPYLGAELVSQGRSLILQGPPGVGITTLTIALAYKALQQGATARFVTCSELIAHLVDARKHQYWDVVLAHYLTPHVLVLDEMGYLTYGPEAANVLFAVLDKRYLAGDRPVLVTTNKAPAQWGRCGETRTWPRRW